MRDVILKGSTSKEKLKHAEIILSRLVKRTPESMPVMKYAIHFSGDSKLSFVVPTKGILKRILFYKELEDDESYSVIISVISGKNRQTSSITLTESLGEVWAKLELKEKNVVTITCEDSPITAIFEPTLIQGNVVEIPYGEEG